MTEQLLLKATEAQLSGNAKCVLIELARRADEDGITGVLSYEMLSDTCGIGVSTVHHAVNRLIDRGFVLRVGRVPKVGCKYQVLSDPDARQGM